MSQAWDRFVESLEGSPTEGLHTLDVGALAELRGAELARATDELLSRLHIGFAPVSRALGLLRDPRVRPALERHLHVAQGPDRIATADALLQHEMSPEVLAVVEEGLQDPDDEVAREAVDAIERLGREAILADDGRLLRALVGAAARHPSDNLRVGAAKLALYAKSVNDSPWSWGHREKWVGIADEDPEQRRRGLRELCKLVQISPDAV